MKFWMALLVMPHVLAWTPPIFMDTMNLENQERPQKVLRGLQLNSPVIEEENSGGDGGQPTATPTESPAPSPSPSAFPTAEPTGTAKPTGNPTISPTESPAPSPSPSAVPTVAPTPGPTQVPSSHPTTTLAPTSSPTISHAPSTTPTSSPSATPSTTPTASPSAVPTYIGEAQASFVVEFDFDNPLAIAEATAFEKATARWVSFLPIKDGTIDDVTCDVYNQVIKTRPNTADGQPQQIHKYLEIFFLIHLEYTGKDTSFDLFEILNDEFQNRNPNWVRALADEDTVFQPLAPASLNIVGSQDGRVQDRVSTKQTSMSKKTYSFILFFSFCALILAVVASVYAIRSHNLSTFGTELRSPMSRLSLSQGRQPSFTMEPKITESESSEASAKILLPAALMPSKNDPPQKQRNKRTSIKSDKEATTREPKRDSTENKESKASRSRRSSVPPPPPPPPPPKAAAAPESSAPAEKRRERDPVAHRASELPEPPAFSEVNFGRDSSLFDRQSFSSDASSDVDLHEPGRISSIMAEKIAKFEKNSDIDSDPGHEMLLTKSFGGTLGAKSISNPGTGSDVSSQAKAFFDNLVKKTSEQIRGSANDDIRPTSVTTETRPGQPPRVPEDLPKSKSQKPKIPSRRSSLLRKPGLYDVFAPPGPIGIVVDTTDNGPAVHSLKNTSPMIGLIAPGDLIVGLDDEDTRIMTAATLTRLMAQKATQKERKITLLTMDE